MLKKIIGGAFVMAAGAAFLGLTGTGAQAADRYTDCLPSGVMCSAQATTSEQQAQTDMKDMEAMCRSNKGKPGGQDIIKWKGTNGTTTYRAVLTCG